MKYRRRREPLEESHVATGWLYADLLLALVVVFLSIAPGIPIYKLLQDVSRMENGLEVRDDDSAVLLPIPTFTSTPTRIPILPTPTPSPPEVVEPLITPSPVGLAPNAQCYDISIEQAAFLSGSSESEAKVVEQLKSILPNSPDTPAGMVIVWARGELTPSLVTASRINGLLRIHLAESFGAAATKSLYFPGMPDLVRLEVYFYTDRPWQSPVASNECP